MVDEETASCKRTGKGTASAVPMEALKGVGFSP